MSSSNFGSWPVPVIAALPTINGGRISPYPCFSVWRLSIKLIRDLSSLAPSPLYTVNLAPDNLAALSKSRMFRSVPISQWALCSKSKVRGSPHFLISTLSESSLPTGDSGFGVLGIPRSSSLNSVCTAFTCSSRAEILSESFFISAISSVVSSPAFFIFGICLESLFCFALRASTSLRRSLLLSSSSMACPML